MDFVAIDVETANASRSSICQVGIAKYVDDALVQTWSSYVDPEAHFDSRNIHIHSLDTAAVKDAPPFPELVGSLYSFLNGATVVCHSHFDRTALHQVAQRYRIPEPDCHWLDSASVARRVWPQRATRGYGLKPLCEMLGYTFTHHDALEDAKAAGFVLIAASRLTGLDIDGLLHIASQRLNHSVACDYNPSPKRCGNAAGALHGHNLVFTGELNLSRSKAADLAASIGCQVTLGVSRKTSILVVGEQDSTLLKGYQKSSKHRKAESLIEQGLDIRIISESEFVALVESYR